MAHPPMDPSTEEASAEQLDRARRPGDASGETFGFVAGEVADEARSGDHLVGYAIEKAEGMYRRVDDGLVRREPEGEIVHVEIAVRQCRRPADSCPASTSPSRVVWHPLLSPYAANGELPGSYTVRVEFPPPSFPRHDETNGRPFLAPCRVELTGVGIPVAATTGES